MRLYRSLAIVLVLAAGFGGHSLLGRAQAPPPPAQGVLIHGDGPFDSLHFQIHEVDCRHAFQAVDRYVEDYKAELAGGLSR